MPAPVDPFPDFVNNVDLADGDKVDARFLALYRALNKAVVGLDRNSIQDGEIITQLLANLGVTGAKIADLTVTGGKVADATLGLAKLTPMLLYGTVNGTTGAIFNAGSGGWTSSRGGVGSYGLTFTVPFSAPPVLLASANTAGSAEVAVVTALAVSTAGITTNITTSGAGADANFTFVAIGAR